MAQDSSTVGSHHMRLHYWYSCVAHSDLSGAAREDAVYLQQSLFPQIPSVGKSDITVSWPYISNRDDSRGSLGYKCNILNINMHTSKTFSQYSS